MQTDSTAPLDPSERAAIARLLERVRATLLDDRFTAAQRPEVLGYLTHVVERAALDLRRGHRAADLDTLAGQLGRFVSRLVGGDVVT
jgi:hypothetical protein